MCLIYLMRHVSHLPDETHEGTSTADVYARLLLRSTMFEQSRNPIISCDYREKLPFADDAPYLHGDYFRSLQVLLHAVQS